MHESFLNSHAPRLNSHKSCMRTNSKLGMRVDENWRSNSRQLSSSFDRGFSKQLLLILPNTKNIKHKVRVVSLITEKIWLNECSGYKVT